MDICFYTSFLFIIPIILACILEVKYVAFTSLLCFITSVINHYYESENICAHTIDTIIVRTIAILHILYALYTYQFTNILMILSYILSIATLIIYIDIKKYKLDEDYHSFVHFFSVCGILFYIFAIYYS
jgi:hypothetical protein